jgi:hypothetical protein
LSNSDKYDGIASLLPKIAVDLFYLGQEQINKYSKNLAKGNPAASASKSKKAMKQNAELRKWAVDYFRSNPYKSYDEAAEYLLPYSLQHGHRMANGNPYATSTIKRAIGKSRDEARAINAANAKK